MEDTQSTSWTWTTTLTLIPNAEEIVAWKLDSVRPYRKALQLSCMASFLGSYTWINPAVSCYNEQFGTGKTIERLPRQSDLCGRIAHLDREETQNVRRQHRSVFAAWIALDRVPFPSTRTSGIFQLNGWASENLQLTLRIRPSQQRTGISLHAIPNSTGRQQYLRSLLHSFRSRAISTPFFPRRLERLQHRIVGGKR